MIKVLIYTIMIYTITIAQTLPHQVAEALQNNNFDLATELVEKFDAVNSTNTETLDNNFAKDVLHRIEIDFNKTEEQVISQIKKILPDVTQEQIEQWEKFCDEIGEEPSNTALAWLLNQPGVTSPIIGPRTIQQLNESMRSLEIKFNEELLSKLDKIFPPAGTSPQYYAW